MTITGPRTRFEAVRDPDAASGLPVRPSTLLTTQARAETSAPILERVGFARVLEMPTFLNR